MSSVIAVGLYSRASVSAAAPVRRDQPLEALLAGGVEQEAGEGQVVLDDQQHAVAGLDVVAVVAGLVDQRSRSAVAARSPRRRPLADRRRAAAPRARRRGVGAGVVGSAPAARLARRRAACRSAAGTA